MDANDEAREDLETVDAEDGDDGERIDSDAAYSRMVKSSQNAWQATLKKHSIDVP